jgi:RNA polymerase sigma factor (sigma-70 family)
MRAVSIPARAPAVPLRSRRLLALAGDKRLVEQVRRGNEAAFEVIFERHGPAILAFCRHMLGTREEAEDAVQHTLAAAYRDLQRGGDREIALKPWLFTIARHRCLSLLRARREVPTATHVLESGSRSGAGLAAEVEERAELRRLLADVRELPDEQRAALLLTELGDLSHAEVAGVLGCEVSRVKGLVFRARSALIARRDARQAPCESIREQLANLRGGSLRRSELRLHLRECPGCRAYREQVRQQRRMLAVALPVAPTLGLKSSVLAAIGIGGGSAGGLTAAAGGIGGATVAKVAVAGVLAGGGVVAGSTVVESDRPAASTPPATQRVGRGELPRAAPGRAGEGASRTVDRSRPDAAGRRAQDGRRALAGGGAAPKAERTEELTNRAGAKTAPGQGRRPVAHGPGQVGHGRGPIDHATKVTPVKRGPPAKPWKAERGAKTVPRGQAKGHAKGAPGPKAGTKPGPRANGHSKPAGSPTGSVKLSPKRAPDAKLAPGAKSQAGAKSKLGVGPKVKGPAVKPKLKAPAGGANRLAQPPKAPKAKTDAISPAAGKPAPPGKQTP